MSSPFERMRSNADVKNTLLWFRNDKKEEDKQQKRLLLQRLLHSRGILEYRPLKTKKNKNRSRRLGKNKKQTKTTNHNMDSEQQLQNAWKERMEMSVLSNRHIAASNHLFTSHPSGHPLAHFYLSELETLNFDVTALHN
jgi:hypothetical protein